MDTKMAPEGEMDPSTTAFLDLLAADIETRPETLVPMDAAWVARLQKLVEGVEISIDEPLPDDASI
jgi:hypothetical protein